MASAEVSTGTDLGSRDCSCLRRACGFRGVDVPLAAGVMGGVKAGETIDLGSSELEMSSTLQSGCGVGECDCGARAGEAWEGSSTIVGHADAHRQDIK